MLRSGEGKTDGCWSFKCIISESVIFVLLLSLVSPTAYIFFFFFVYFKVLFYLRSMPSGNLGGIGSRRGRRNVDALH
jgi:hypothetical protein